MEIASKPHSADEAPPAQPFCFLALPYELRIRVYEHVLVFPRTVDLDPANTRTLVHRLCLFLVSHAVHTEASRIFYSRNTFRIFPIHGRFFHTKRPLLARLPPTYRAHLTKLELRLGPGWTKPPKGWVADSRLGLEDAPKVHLLKVFVECDPASSDVFDGFRHGEGEEFYTTFCVGLLSGLFAGLPALSRVQFDAYPSVSKTSPLLKRLVDEARANQKIVLWGPERGWDKIAEVDLAQRAAEDGIGIFVREH
ncbi:hypothetical protein K458DRAFT_319797 [Lentithecium fluviatile CBS 122367]|uniref:F-box domain-containing protein n=1 Tax=Lentithecium fluviatile CBS 122367 TaxID=1168545 RepID=A0A6G1IH04_9PLEO|nr:hypothetical protein K458DRAFT_319797 [Lentithecium fluviatile CBS 122367]